ncbi:MAG: hypothetical protein NDJ89_18200 [Oligoflexia bacterium]|nr:hypothetical protein [Oligoflexia bacterium]
MRWNGIGAVLLLLASFAPSAQGAIRWEELKALYDARRYEDAQRLLLENPESTHDYYYNLGTLAYRLSRHGLAVAYLEKAYRMKPYDSDTRQNLELARSGLAQVIGASKLDPGSTPLEAFGDLLAPPAARAALGTLGLFLILLGLLRYRKDGDLRESLSHPQGALGALGLVLELLLVSAQWLDQRHPAAFPLERLTVRSGPGDQYLELAQVEAGVKLRILSTGGSGDEWRQIRYAPDRIGWVRAPGLLKP